MEMEEEIVYILPENMLLERLLLSLGTDIWCFGDYFQRCEKNYKISQNLIGHAKKYIVQQAFWKNGIY